MFDVVVSIENRTVRKVWHSCRDAVLVACDVIAVECNNYMVDYNDEQRDRFIDHLVDTGWTELDEPGDVPHIAIRVHATKIRVRLESESFEYRYENIGTYSHASGNTLVDDGAWGRIAYHLLRRFCIRSAGSSVPVLPVSPSSPALVPRPRSNR